MALAMIFLAHCIGRRFPLRRPPLWQVIAAIFLFWAFVWLSPQIYYLYYLWLLPDLPTQWVIQKPPDVIELLRLLTLSAKANLSDHSKALLGWLMIAASLWHPRRVGA